MTDQEPIITTSDLTKNYDEVTVVDRVNFRINEGEIFGLLGPNGAGKTTTILMLLGLTEPASGSAQVCGFNPNREPLKVKRLVGYMPEKVGFYENLTAAENMDFIAELNSISRQKAAAKISELLGVVGLGKVVDKKVGEFSRGMKQRLGIADALIKEPKVAIFDEPTAGLDPEGISQILDMLARLPERGTTVVMCSHRLYEVQQVCNRIGIMSGGQLVVEDSIQNLGRQVLAGGRYQIEIETSQPSPQVIKLIKSISGVSEVEHRGDLLLINAEQDLRAEIAKVLVQNDFPLKEMKIQEFALDEIYMKYFPKADNQ